MTQFDFNQRFQINNNTNDFLFKLIIHGIIVDDLRYLVPDSVVCVFVVGNQKEDDDDDNT